MGERLIMTIVTETKNGNGSRRVISSWVINNGRKFLGSAVVAGGGLVLTTRRGLSSEGL
jgi:hypothetical protein